MTLTPADYAALHQRKREAYRLLHHCLLRLPESAFKTETAAWLRAAVHADSIGSAALRQRAPAPEGS